MVKVTRMCDAIVAMRIVMMMMMMRRRRRGRRRRRTRRRMVPPTRRCRVERIASSGACGGIVHVKAVEEMGNLFVKRIRNNHHKRD